jgi:YhcH/YjgK/YiaL family protein
MIFDMMEKSGFYFPTGSLFLVGIEFIKKVLRENPADGRHELGGGVYTTIQTYRTAQPDGKLPESHKKYADIQTLISGSEIIGWLPVDGLEIEKQYDDQKDIVFYKSVSGETPLLHRPGLFSVFFPGDAHKPGMTVTAPEEVRKVVVKIPL